MRAATLALLAGLAGVGASAVSPVVRPEVVALPAAVVAFVTAAHRLRRDGWSRRVPQVAIPVGIAVVQLASGGQLGMETAVAVVVGLVTWGLVGATVIDLEGIDRALPATEGMAPLGRLRVRFVAVGLAASACAAVGAVPAGGMTDLGRAAATSWSAAPLAYFVVGLGAVGVAARSAERRRWERDGATIDGRLGHRWMMSLVATVALLATAALVVERAPTGISALPSRAVASSGSVGAGWLDGSSPSFTAGDEPAAGERTTASLPAVTEQTPTAPWVGEAALIVLFAVILGFAIVRGRNRPERVRRSETAELEWGEMLRSVVEELAAVFRALWSALRGVTRRVRPGRSVGNAATPTSRPTVAWTSRDPLRRRIAIAYRRAVGAVVPPHAPPRHPETPREFADRVDDVRLAVVTQLYEEARYSDHVLGEDHASAAERAAGGLDSSGGGPFGPGRGPVAE